MKSFYFIFIVLFCFMFANSFAQPWEVSWKSELGNSKMDFFSDVVEDKNGEYIVLGSTFIQGNSYDFWLICYNENGDTLWTKTLGTEYRDVPRRIVHSADGGLLLMGNCENENRKELIVIRTDEKGNEEWRKVFKDGNNYTGEDMALLEDNGFVLVGAKGVSADNANLWMAQMNADGSLVWEKIFQSNLNGSFKSVKKLPTGGFAIAGHVYENGKNACDILLTRTDNKGESKWFTRISSPGTKEWPECVCCSPDSCFMLVGWKGICLNDISSPDAIFDFDMVLNKIDQNGKVIWTKNFDREGSEGGNAVTIRPDGDFIIAGIKATSFLGKVGPWLLHIDAEGNTKDENLIKFHFNKDQASKVINCSDGGFVVVGPGIQEDSNFRSNGWIMKFASL